MPSKSHFRSRQITSKKKVVQFEGSRGQIRDSTPRKDIKPQKQQCSLNLTHSSRSKAYTQNGIAIGIVQMQ